MLHLKLDRELNRISACHQQVMQCGINIQSGRFSIIGILNLLWSTWDCYFYFLTIHEINVTNPCLVMILKLLRESRKTMHTLYLYSLFLVLNLQEKLWQCFLQGASEVSSSPVDQDISLSRIDRMGMDSAKLHCCYKATSPSCRRLCLKTFSNEWSKSWEDFDKDCLSQLSETALENCLNEGEWIWRSVL